MLKPQILKDANSWMLVGYGAEIPLPLPATLKRQAIEEAYGEDPVMCERVIDLLEACTFDYEVVPGKDSITWLFGVVINTDAEHAPVFENNGDPLVHCFFGALSLAVRPMMFETDRVVICE